MTSLNKKIIWAVLLGLATVLAISLLADYKAAMEALRRFDLKYLPLVLGLTFLNYLLRFVKWHYFLGIIEVKLGKVQSFTVFLSGLAMSVTPGKVGEVLKSFLLKEMKGIPISRTAPIILAERLSDALGLVILSLAGMWYFQYGRHVVILVAVLLLALVLLLQFPRATGCIINIAGRIRFLQRFEGSMHNMMDSAHQLIRPLPLLFTVVISVVSWFFECLAFYFVFMGLGYHVSVLIATFTLALSGIVGAVSMLPGGLGVAEGSLLGLLVLVGVPKGIAAVATIIIRFCTLWFGVLVGIIALAFNKRVLGLTGDLDKEILAVNEQGSRGEKL